MSGQARLIESREDICRLLSGVRRIAVLGIKTEAQSQQPAFYVPTYLMQAGLEVIPVPVYFPMVQQILGQPVFRQLVDIPGELDLVDIFRRSQDLPAHLDDVVAKRPRAVWLQQGIRHEGFARSLIEAGISVVQDLCLMVEHRRCAENMGLASHG